MRVRIVVGHPFWRGRTTRTYPLFSSTQFPHAQFIPTTHLASSGPAWAEAFCHLQAVGHPSVAVHSPEEVAGLLEGDHTTEAHNHHNNHHIQRHRSHRQRIGRNRHSHNRSIRQAGPREVDPHNFSSEAASEEGVAGGKPWREFTSSLSVSLSLSWHLASTLSTGNKGCNLLQKDKRSVSELEGKLNWADRARASVSCENRPELPLSLVTPFSLGTKKRIKDRILSPLHMELGSSQAEPEL